MQCVIKTIALFAVMKAELGTITVIQVQTNQLNPLTAQALLGSPNKAPEVHSQPTNRPRRKGSLPLFFRKVRWSTTQSATCFIFSVLFIPNVFLFNYISNSQNKLLHMSGILFIFLTNNHIIIQKVLFIWLFSVLFFCLVKVYHLASVRLRDLCLKLDISGELRSKIWTCFEQSLVHCTDMMKDRHLDQLLLCAVYIISKASDSVVYYHMLEHNTTLS